MDEKNRREERKSGTIGTVVSQKDLQIKKCYELLKNALSWAISDEIESK